MIKIKGNHTALFNVKGKRSLSMTFNLSDPENMKGLSQQVQKLADEHVQVGQVLISAEDDVDYKAVADVMGQLNDSKIPVVMGEF